MANQLSITNDLSTLLKQESRKSCKLSTLLRRVQKVESKRLKIRSKIKAKLGNNRKAEIETKIKDLQKSQHRLKDYHQWCREGVFIAEITVNRTRRHMEDRWKGVRQAEANLNACIKRREKNKAEIERLQRICSILEQFEAGEELSDRDTAVIVKLEDEEA